MVSLHPSFPTTHGPPAVSISHVNQRLVAEPHGTLAFSCTQSTQLPGEMKLKLAVLAALVWLLLWLSCWQANSHRFIFPGDPSPLLGLLRKIKEVGVGMDSQDYPCVRTKTDRPIHQDHAGLTGSATARGWGHKQLTGDCWPGGWGFVHSSLSARISLQDDACWRGCTDQLAAWPPSLSPGVSEG